jgi:hypothetical protein
MDNSTPKKYKKSLKVTQDGCIGGARTRAFRITQ